MASEITSKSEFDEKIRNITGILQDKFPKIDLSDIPGFNNEGDGTTTTRSSNFALFMLSLILGIFWITYITLINARVVGKIITKIINRFVPDGYIKVSEKGHKSFFFDSQSDKTFLFFNFRWALFHGLFFLEKSCFETWFMSPLITRSGYKMVSWCFDGGDLMYRKMFQRTCPILILDCQFRYLRFTSHF